MYYNRPSFCSGLHYWVGAMCSLTRVQLRNVQLGEKPKFLFFDWLDIINQWVRLHCSIFLQSISVGRPNRWWGLIQPTALWEIHDSVTHIVQDSHTGSRGSSVSLVWWRWPSHKVLIVSVKLWGFASFSLCDVLQMPPAGMSTKVIAKTFIK